MLLAPLTMRSLPKGTKVIKSLISSGILKGDSFNASKFDACHCANGNSQVKGKLFTSFPCRIISYIYIYCGDV